MTRNTRICILAVALTAALAAAAGFFTAVFLAIFALITASFDNLPLIGYALLVWLVGVIVANFLVAVAKP